MSRKIEQYGAEGTTMNYTGPIRWMAPESIGAASYSAKSDVWMFACFIFELIMEVNPFPEFPQDRLLDLATSIRDGSACFRFSATI